MRAIGMILIVGLSACQPTNGNITGPCPGGLCIYADDEGSDEGDAPCPHHPVDTEDSGEVTPDAGGPSDDGTDAGDMTDAGHTEDAGDDDDSSDDDSSDDHSSGKKPKKKGCIKHWCKKCHSYRCRRNK